MRAVCGRDEFKVGSGHASGCPRGNLKLVSLKSRISDRCMLEWYEDVDSSVWLEIGAGWDRVAWPNYKMPNDLVDVLESKSLHLARADEIRRKWLLAVQETLDSIADFPQDPPLVVAAASLRIIETHRETEEELLLVEFDDAGCRQGVQRRLGGT